MRTPYAEGYSCSSFWHRGVVTVLGSAATVTALTSNKPRVANISAAVLLQKSFLTSRSETLRGSGVSNFFQGLSNNSVNAWPGTKNTFKVSFWPLTPVWAGLRAQRASEAPPLDVFKEQDVPSQSTQLEASDATPPIENNLLEEKDGLSGPNSAEQLCFKAAAASIPHPNKVNTGGEDAYFIADNGLALGIADGVGGWAEVKIDAGVYSRLLMKNAKKHAEEATIGPDAPQEVLVKAHRETDALGSSTACVVILEGSKLHATNCGDSGFMVLRNNQLIFNSPPQTKQFNFPYQLAFDSNHGDDPSTAQRFSVDVKQGDVVVLATDGLLDNVFTKETVSIVDVMRRKGASPNVTAAALSRYAKTKAEGKTNMTPFAVQAQNHGIHYFGGKEDDITVIVAYLSSASSL